MEASMMGFELFMREGRSCLPKVSIWNRGQMSISAGAVKKYGLDKFNFVRLFFDKERNRIGLHFTSDKDEEGAVEIRKRPSGFMVNAKAFLDYYDVAYAQGTKKYSLERLKEATLANFFVLDLNKVDHKMEQASLI